MARPSPDYLMATLVHGYLGTEASRTAGVPTAAQAALHLMDDGKHMAVPQLLVAAVEDKESKTSARRVINVTVFLFYRLKNQEQDAPQDQESLRSVITREQASSWMDAVESRLRNLDAFMAYVAAQPEEKRQGWQLMAWRPEATAEIKRDDGTPGQTLAANVRIYLAWSRSV